jgi:hypothetical protein
MSKLLVKKIISHPDKDELISKMIIGISIKDIHEWLASKYVNPNESKFVISEKDIKKFKDTHLDIYSLIQEDLSKAKSAIANNNEDLELAIQNVPAYQQIVLKAVNEELDIRKIIKNLCVAIETRISQLFDEIQADPTTINTKIDRLLIDWMELLGNQLEKYYKFTEAPADNIIQHNMTIQVMDQHVTILHDAIKETLSQMDLQSSLYFMEIFNEKISKLKISEKESLPNPEIRLAEVKILNETISNRINQ